MDFEDFRSPFEIIKSSWWQYLLKKADSLVMRTRSSFAESSLSFVFLPADGQCGPFKFINMCVTDSLLMAFYCCYFKSDKVRSLFNFHENMRAAMVFVGAEMYSEAKACWVFGQFDLAENSLFHINKVNNAFLPCFEVNARSEPKDHLKLLNELVLVTYHFDKNETTTTFSQDILCETLRKFEHLGDVYALGCPSDYNPVAIIVDVDRRLDTAPPLIIYDDYGRCFEVQFFLMTRKSHPEHVVAGLHLFHGWTLYDDLKIKHKDFDPRNADFKDDFIVLLAGYISIEPDKTHHVKFSVPEEGRDGTRVFNPSSYSNIHEKQHLD